MGNTLLRQRVNTYISLTFVLAFGIMVSNVVLHVAHAASPIDGAIGKAFSACPDYDTCAAAK